MGGGWIGLAGVRDFFLRGGLTDAERVGVCSDVASATRSVLGEFCGIAAPCQPACAVRPGLSCSSGRCERSQLGLDCPCEPTGVPCGPSLFCDHNVNRTAAENVCRMQTVPATGACAVDSQCPGTCDNGVCMGLASNVTCSSSRSASAVELE